MLQLLHIIFIWRIKYAAKMLLTSDRAEEGELVLEETGNSVSCVGGVKTTVQRGNERIRHQCWQLLRV